jgi:hypothetical protein
VVSHKYEYIYASILLRRIVDLTLYLRYDLVFDFIDLISIMSDITVVNSRTANTTGMAVYMLEMTKLTTGFHAEMMG